MDVAGVTGIIPNKPPPVMPNSRSSDKKALGCYLPAWKLERIKDIATGMDLTTTDLIDGLIDACIAREDADQSNKERPMERPKNWQGTEYKGAIKPENRTQNPLLQRVQVRSLSPVVLG